MKHIITLHYKPLQDTIATMDDETILDIVGVVLVSFALLVGISSFSPEVPTIEVLQTSSTFGVLGVAAIVGAGGVMAFLKNR